MKTYKLDYNSGEAEIILKVDRELFTNSSAKTCLDFYNLSYDENEDLVTEYLPHLAAMILETALREEINTAGVINELAKDKYEAWPKLDGSSGVLLHSMTHFEINYFDFELEEK